MSIWKKCFINSTKIKLFSIFLAIYFRLNKKQSPKIEKEMNCMSKFLMLQQSEVYVIICIRSNIAYLMGYKYIHE